ncbi:Uncharacterized protein Adt_27298 [Abeliophyllum distichum]|uniref:Uncharacterized protein n=1 Tax=Abeliophyllum distichum TaxID=126358 RepID=A0ABD1RTB9_9LAMI
MEFSAEDFKSIDESVNKNENSDMKGKWKAITPIPFIVEDELTFQPTLKRIIKPSSCVQSPYVKSYRSKGEVHPIDPTLSFQYKFFLNSPDLSDYTVFEKWYS